MRKSVLLWVLFVFVAVAGYAQNTNNNLEIKREAEPVPGPLLGALKHAGQDTGRVGLLLKLSHIYWHSKAISKTALDSSLFFAVQAGALAHQLQFTAGNNEAAFMMCKIYIAQKNVAQALGIADQFYGEQRARLLLAIAEYHVFRHDPGDPEFLRAPALIMQAKAAAGSAHSVNWLSQCSVLLAKYYFKQGEVEAGKKTLMETINAFHKSGQYNEEARYWSILGTYMPESESNYPDMKHAHEMAVHYYQLAGNREEEAYSLRDLSDLNANYNAPLAEKQLIEVLGILKSINAKISSTTYLKLADLYRYNGSYDKAILYAFKAMSIPQSNPNKAILPNQVLADTYSLIGQYQKALFYYRIMLDYEVPRNIRHMNITANQIARCEAADGQPAKALSFFSSFAKKYAPANYTDRQLNAATFGEIFSALGKYDKAEHYYLEMLSLEDKVNEEISKDIDFHFRQLSNGASFTMGKFYIERADYKKAQFHLLKSLNNPHYVDARQLSDTYLLLFKADSALGNYIPAIKYFEHHKVMFDSLNSVAKNRKIEELGVKYETEQKAKDIRLLENKQKLQQAVIQRSDSIRNFIIAAAILLFLLALSAYVGYYNKQRSNLKLKSQQEEINAQNVELQSLLLEKDLFLIEKDSLLEEKDGLLKEKDWLLKEVHHRVKNNLQLVMSLLRSQSAFLKNEDAKGAITESENRVQAIALIHQKLYSTDNLASIGMPAYVSELINYLTDGLNTRGRNIIFRQSVELIFLDLAQAVPIGLILNEAITNAIKYAFGPGGGEIIVTFRRTEGQNVMLSIADNGKGLPADFNFDMPRTLGMQMMKGLCGQLKGTCDIINESGLTVVVSFKMISILPVRGPEGQFQDTPPGGSHSSFSKS